MTELEEEFNTLVTLESFGELEAAGQKRLELILQEHPEFKLEYKESRNLEHLLEFTRVPAFNTRELSETKIEELIKTILAKDSAEAEAALLHLFDNFYPGIKNYVLTGISDPGLAENITQLVFYTIIKNLQAFQFEVSFRAFIYRLAFLELQKDYRGRGGGEDLLPPENKIPVPNNPPSAETIDEFRKIQPRFSPENVELMGLLQIQDSLSISEIAYIMNIDETDARTKVENTLDEYRRLKAQE